MEAGLIGDEAYDKYINQLNYRTEQDIYQQTNKAQKEFEELFQYNKMKNQERYVQNKVGIGLHRLDLQNIKVINEVSSEQQSEIQDEYVQNPRLQKYNFQPIIPGFFTQLDADCEKQTHIFYDQDKQRYKCQFDKPNHSEFTPQPQNLLQYREKRRKFFQSVVDRVILMNRAQKQINLIKQKILKGDNQKNNKEANVEQLQHNRLQKLETNMQDVGLLINSLHLEPARVSEEVELKNDTVQLQTTSQNTFRIEQKLPNDFYDLEECSYHPRKWTVE